MHTTARPTALACTTILFEAWCEWIDGAGAVDCAIGDWICHCCSPVTRIFAVFKNALAYSCHTFTHLIDREDNKIDLFCYISIEMPVGDLEDRSG